MVLVCGSGGVGKTTTAAAMARAGGDRDRRPRARAHRRPGAPARRRARCRCDRQRGAARAGRGVRGVGRRTARRAVGGDARHEGRLGRADPPPRAERRGAGVGARQPAVPEHHRPLRAQPRLPGDGPTPRAARVGPVRPDHRRHAAVAERARRARRAGADEGILRVAAAEVADAARTGHGCSRPPRSPSTKSPTACSARGSCRTSPSSSSCSRRWNPASSPTPARSSRCSSIPRTTFVVVSTLEAAPTHEASYLARALRDRDMHLGAIVANRVLPAGITSKASATSARKLAALDDEHGGAGRGDARRRPRGRRRACCVTSPRSSTTRRWSPPASPSGAPSSAALAPLLVSIPLLAGDVNDIADLLEIARALRHMNAAGVSVCRGLRDRRIAVRVTPGALREIRAGSPWVFDGSITSVSDAGAPGDLAVIFDDKRRFAAIGLWDPGSPMRVKVLHTGAPATIDADWWRRHAAGRARPPRQSLAARRLDDRLPLRARRERRAAGVGRRPLRHDARRQALQPRPGFRT